MWCAGGDRAPRTPLPAVGDEVTGKVNRTAAFGVFVDLENNIRGLLHVDEVVVPEGDKSREPNLRAMFSEGEEVKVRLGRRRPSLCLSMSPCRSPYWVRVSVCMYAAHLSQTE